MALTSYTREDLFQMNPGKVQLPKELFDVLQELKICSSKKTHRGCRGGQRRRQRVKACQTGDDGAGECSLSRRNVLQSLDSNMNSNNNNNNNSTGGAEQTTKSLRIEDFQRKTSNDESCQTTQCMIDRCTQTEEIEATNTNVCEIDEDIKKKLRAFRFRKAKTNAAIVLKIDKENMKIIEDSSFDEDDLEGMDPDTLSSELPAHAPRFVAYSYCYHHDDGRISYPLCLIHSAPPGCNPEIQMMYAGSRNNLVKVGEFTKVFEVRNPEEIDEEWLKSKLAFFR